MPAIALQTSETPLSPESVLKDVFGFPTFRPGQRDIIQTLLAGNNTLAVMPTGAGKSLCYQVPALIFDRPTVVVSPLVALMDNQVAGLRANGVDASCIHSGQSREENVHQWRRVAQGASKLLYLSPERLMTPRMLSAMRALNPAMFVVDEAHCVSKWGPAFRPEYADLGELKRICPDAVVGAFTATADTLTRQDIADRLFGGHGKTIVHGFDRPNLELNVMLKTNRQQQVLDFMADRKGVSGIIYCLSRKSTEETARSLTARGYTALPYHAGLEPDVRFRNQERFMAEDGVVMVATIAFGMGIDKPDIRFVFHLNIPGSMEAYYQEIGRAGRDGAPAVTTMLYGLDDVRMRRQFITNDGSDDAHQSREHKRLDALLSYCEASGCRRQVLLSYFGERTQPCGNCDNCINPPAMKDATVPAKALMRTIGETGSRFGQAHIVDVARGAQTARIKQFGHDSLNCHGNASAFGKAWLQGLIRQMIAGGLLDMDIARYGALTVTDAGHGVLSGQETFTCKEISQPKTSDSRVRAARKKAVERELSDRDRDLLATLKALRTDIAKEISKPAYIVFSDATLMDMARKKPTSEMEMMGVSGVGAAKYDKFGRQFIDAIQAEI